MAFGMAKGDVKMQLDIVPFTLSQFKEYFVSLFESGNYGKGEILTLITSCGKDRVRYDAPSWKTAIGDDVATAIRDNHRHSNKHSEGRSGFLVAAEVAASKTGDEYSFATRGTN